MTRLSPKPDPDAGERLDGSRDSQPQSVGADRQRSLRPAAIGFGLGALATAIALQLLSARAPDTTESAGTATPTGAIAAGQTAPSISVTAAVAEETVVARRLDATGSVAARELLPIGTQATGLQIREVLAAEGELVRAGQVLARLDDTFLQAELAGAQADVAEAEARLEELQTGARAEEIARATEAVNRAAADIRRAESNVALARQRAESNRLLATEGAIARDRLAELLDSLQSEEAELESARAQLREDEQFLQELRAGTRPEALRQAEARLARARAQERSASAQLQTTRVLAPAAGRILERQARIGDVVANTDTLFTLIEDDRLELRLRVPETQLGNVRPGQTIVATASIAPSQTFQGTIREIQPEIDEDSRLATVEVDLPADARLRPGMFLRAQITTSTLAGVALPSKAVLPQPNGSGIVYRLQADGTVAPVTIELGELLPDGQIEVLAGLEPGERVAVEGVAYLKPGDRVTVVPQ